MKVLITGAAGFIGFHTCRRLLAQGHEVIGVDNLNDYYEVALKKSRLAQLQSETRFTFVLLDIAHREALQTLFSQAHPPWVIHLAAQAGVRHSLENPYAYVESNLVGFINLLEACRHHPVKHLVFASSSSVYGANRKTPFVETDNVDYPVSLYAATKKSNELMAHTYSHLYQIPTTGLRFFTVYGPWGRPDMAYFLFTKAILTGKPIKVFNQGKMQRDFTYIDDIVGGIVQVLQHPPVPPSEPMISEQTRTLDSPTHAPYRIYNLGNHHPVPLLIFIEILEKALGKTAVKELLPMQPGDVPCTYASIDRLANDVGFKPQTPLTEGIQQFVDWYLSYYSPT